MKGDKDTIEGWQVDSKEVRQIATELDIPPDVPLPEVVVIGKDEDEFYQEGPQINIDSSGKSPSGYFITVPESMLEEVSETHYVTGSRTRQNIRHELSHYMDYREGGSTPGRYEDPYAQAVKEIRADLRGGVRDLSLTLSKQALNLKCDYDLSDTNAFEIVAKVARSQGVSSSTISRAKKLYFASIRDFRE